METICNADKYQKLAMRTANPECHSLSNFALGLAGESGEVADIVKKHLHQGHLLDADHIIEELGDILWYVALAADTLDVSLSFIMTYNVNKLKNRYPDGFDPERSIHREESHE